MAHASSSSRLALGQLLVVNPLQCTAQALHLGFSECLQHCGWRFSCWHTLHDNQGSSRVCPGFGNCRQCTVLGDARVQAAHNEVVALAGFHIKRQEFEPEYDNEAEMIVADMEFKEDDTEVS